jgi:hypothetical protein
MYSEKPLLEKSINEIIQETWAELANQFTIDGKKNIDNLKDAIAKKFDDEIRELNKLPISARMLDPEIVKRENRLKDKKKCVLEEQIELERPKYERDSVNLTEAPSKGLTKI